MHRKPLWRNFQATSSTLHLLLNGALVIVSPTNAFEDRHQVFIPCSKNLEPTSKLGALHRHCQVSISHLNSLVMQLV